MEASPLTLLTARPWFLVYLLLSGGRGSSWGCSPRPRSSGCVSRSSLSLSHNRCCWRFVETLLWWLRSSLEAAGGKVWPLLERPSLGQKRNSKDPGPRSRGPGQHTPRADGPGRGAGCFRVGSGSRAAVGDCRGSDGSVRG